MKIELNPEEGLQGFSYYRVSTPMQKSIPTQRAVCIDYARRHGLIIVKGFEEVGSALKPRPVFKEMIDRISEVNFIMVHFSDRLYKTMEDLNYISPLFNQNNVVLIISSLDKVKNPELVKSYLEAKEAILEWNNHIEFEIRRRGIDIS